MRRPTARGTSDPPVHTPPSPRRRITPTMVGHRQNRHRSDRPNGPPALRLTDRAARCASLQTRRDPGLHAEGQRIVPDRSRDPGETLRFIGGCRERSSVSQDDRPGWSVACRDRRDGPHARTGPWLAGGSATLPADPLDCGAWSTSRSRSSTLSSATWGPSTSASATARVRATMGGLR